MDYKVRGSHEQGVNLTQDTSNMTTARVNMRKKRTPDSLYKSSTKYGRKERGHYKRGKVPNKI